ncbi:gastric triacylglycerol lipase-like isoform X1 [Macrobrachium nipponense]|uniref:gastric triacylglycerol lipase-like isoform X1 n=1 Tax=Macrobrachium nipponense TaxID=159736 RepID=UPI0030C845C8
MAALPKVLATIFVAYCCYGISQADNNRTSRIRRGFRIHPHTYMTTAEMIRARGYPAEVHHVVTDDGYILEVHRIPFHSRLNLKHSVQNEVEKPIELQLLNTSARTDHEKSSAGEITHRGDPKVVFLLHCFLCSSADFVMNDHDQALAFVMSNEGYDVWLGNMRGNIYGRRHTKFSPSDTQFWEFSIDTCARYDVPAMLQYVRTQTGVNQLNYIGHSMGNMLFFAMMSIHPHINSWIRAMAGMGPVAYMYHGHAQLGFLAPVTDKLERSLAKKGQLEFMAPTNTTAMMVSGLCSETIFFRPICQLIVDMIAGPSSRNVDPVYLPVIAAHTPAGSSFRIFAHLLQFVRDRTFQAYDWGPTKNHQLYGSLRPTRLELSKVTVPVAGFWSSSDVLADPRDVARTLREVSNLVLNHQVQHNSFNHMDFLWGENARSLVYKHIIDFFDQYY